MVDRKRIETLRSHIATYEQSLAAYEQLMAQLESLPRTPHRDQMLKINAETVAAISHSLALARKRLDMYEKAPRLSRPAESRS